MTMQTLAKAATAADSNRTIRKETIVTASLAEVWKAWTTSKGAETFFGPKANISLRIGGPYEIFFDPTDETMSSRGMRVISYLPMKLLSFEWNAPPQFPVVRANPIWVIVQFKEIGPRKDAETARVQVALTHFGWREGAEWDKAFAYFDRAWDIVLENLKKRFDQISTGTNSK